MGDEKPLPFQKITGGIVKFHHPFSCLAVGPSSAGKTHFLLSLIKHRHAMITPRIDRVVYCYKRYQKVFDDVIRQGDGGVEFVLGHEYKHDPKQNTLLILDDMLLEASLPLAEIFTVRVHHDNLSVIYVSHTLFYNDPQFRLASLNTQYFILFRSPRGHGQVSHLAGQIFTHDKFKRRKLVRAYADATLEPFSYLLVDLLPLTPNTVRLRADILPTEGLNVEGKALTKSYPL